MSGALGSAFQPAMCAAQSAPLGEATNLRTEFFDHQSWSRIGVDEDDVGGPRRRVVNHQPTIDASRFPPVVLSGLDASGEDCHFTSLDLHLDVGKPSPSKFLDGKEGELHHNLHLVPLDQPDENKSGDSDQRT